MTRFFVDTSVLFSALYSPTGGSARLITDAINQEIELVISEDVADELREAFAERSTRDRPPDQVALSGSD